MDTGIETAVTYGDPDNGYAVCMRDYRINDAERFKVELWLDGGIVDMFYGASLEACHAWLESLGSERGEQLGKTICLAPQSIDNCKTVRWVLCDEGRADDSWWDDCESWPQEMRRFIHFRDMRPLP